MTTSTVALWLAFATLAADPAPAAPPFALQGGETVVFFGDSITQGGQYIDYVEASLRTRLPEKSIRIINSGISSETISGTSEPDHDPRRPYAHERFDRDVAAHRPQMVVACFGMNDGNYHPFESERFKKYQAGVRLLIDRTNQAGAKISFMTPPPFDAYRRSASDPNATDYGYKFAAVDYDTTLEVYSQWLVRLRDEGFTVADVHTASNAHLAARRKSKVSFFLAGDAVHPNATGHWLMAQTLLEAWRFPATWADLHVSLDSAPAAGAIAATRDPESGAVKFSATLGLPVPFDTQWDAESLKLERFAERFNHGRLKVAGLTPGSFDVLVDGQRIGTATGEELAAGVDLNRFTDWSVFKQSQEVLTLVQQRRRAIYQAWRAAVKDPAVKEAATAVKAAEEAAQEVEQKLAALAKPRAYQFTLTPTK